MVVVKRPNGLQRDVSHGIQLGGSVVAVRRTEQFNRWFRNLRDIRAKARINLRIRRLSLGNPGDVRAVGGGVSELRINYGPGYRVYFVRQECASVILLNGGGKPTQERDIARARALALSLGR